MENGPKRNLFRDHPAERRHHRERPLQVVVDDGGFDVFVMNIEGATHTITGVKQTTTVNEFVQLVSRKTGIPSEQIKLVSNDNY
jgi:hypothetical protein